MKTSLSIVAFVLLIIATSCKSSEKNGEIKVGVIAPLTGEFSRFGVAMQLGIDMAAEDLNKVSGKTYNILYQDDKGDNKEATSAFSFLSDVKNVPVILGAAKSGTSIILAPLANTKKVVLFSSISTADTLKYAGDYFFRNVPPNSFQAISIANYLLNDAKKKKVGILYENDEYGVNMKSVFEKYFPSNGGSISYSYPYQEKQSDFKNIIDKISKSDAEVIFVPGTVWGIAMFVRQLRERGVNTPIITGDGGYGADDMLKIAGKTANGYICSFMTIEDTTSKAYTDFKERFVKKYNKQPDVYSVYSYDALMMVNEAIKSIKGKINGESIKNALYKVQYEGIGGSYSFDSYGEVKKSFGLFEYHDGVYSRIK